MSSNKISRISSINKMPGGILYNLWIWISMYTIVFGTVTETRPMDNSFDSISNRTVVIFRNIYNPIANGTKHIIDNISEYNTSGVLDSIYSRAEEISSNIYNPIANGTKHIIDNISEYNTSGVPEKATACSIVLGSALIGAVIGPLAVGLGIPLVLCILGFTCWGVMAGSAAACCQSGIGNVPAGGWFACFQSTGAGGGKLILILACIIGIPLGFGLGGYIAETYVHCFFR